MTLAFDATSGAAALNTSAATITWTHTPVGTPGAVAVLIPQGVNTDQVSAVSYGGVALSRVRFDARAAAETCATYIYFLGSGIPTGPQTVSVTSTGTNPKWPQVVTWTSAQNTSVTSQAGGDAGIIANPSLTLTPPRQAGCVYVCASGLNAPVPTPQTGTVQLATYDLGTISAHLGYKVTGGTTTVGWTSAIDDVCHSAAAITELVVVEGTQGPIVSPSRAVHRSTVW